MSTSKNLTLLSWFNFWCDFRLYAPVAVLYFTKVSGSFALGMSVFSAVMLSQALFEVPTGLFSDFLGRRRTVIWGAALSVLAVTVYALSRSYLWLILGAVLEGIGRSFYSGNNDALLMDTLKETGEADKYHVYAGKIGSWFQVALAVSALLGGFVANFSFRWVLWVSVVPQLICLIIGFRLHEPRLFSPGQANLYAHFKQSFRRFLHQPKLRTICLSSSLGFGAGEAGYQFRAAFISLFWPIWAIGLVAMLSNIGAAVSFYLSGKIINKFKELPVLIFSGIYNRIITLIALLFPSLFSPLLMSSSSLLYGVETTSENTLLQKEFTDMQRATMGSINSLLGSLFFAIISVLLGLGADKLGPVNALLVLQIPLALSLFLYVRLFQSGKHLSALPNLHQTQLVK